MQDMSWRYKTVGTASHTFEAVSAHYTGNVDDGVTLSEHIYLKLPRKVARSHTKGIDEGSKNLSVFNIPFPLIELKETYDKSEAGFRYRVETKPTRYRDNSGTYYWDTECTVTALDGGYQPDNPLYCLLGSGFYQNDGETCVRQCDNNKETDLPAIVWIPLVLLDSGVLIGLFIK